MTCRRPVSVLCLSIVLGAFALAPGAARAGDLAPPAGPVSPTMKTLDEVEPRVPIHQADIPLTITQSGSYYLAEALSNPAAQSFTFITIDADGVSLDLMGFAIDGEDMDAFQATIGVAVVSGRREVSIRNGTIRRVRGGVAATGATALDIRDLRIDSPLFGWGVRPGNSTVISNVHVTRSNWGFELGVCSDVLLEHCSVSGANVAGFYVDSGGSNVLIRHCRATACGTGFENSFNGVNVTVIGCEASACATGFRDVPLNSHWLKNVASNCTTGFVFIVGVSANPTTAGPWANLDV